MGSTGLGVSNTRALSSGATRCRYCALFHTEAARLFGATDQEIAEASAMGGMTMLASSFLNSMQIDYDQFMDMVASSAPSVGHCNTMGTATSMNSLAEALGMSLPGCAAIPASACRGCTGSGARRAPW